MFCWYVNSVVCVVLYVNALSGLPSINKVFHVSLLPKLVIVHHVSGIVFIVIVLFLEFQSYITSGCYTDGYDRIDSSIYHF